MQDLRSSAMAAQAIVEFYDLVDDPLEEYQLSKPSDCTGFRATWTPVDPQWNYCRLIEVVNTYSIF